MKSHIWAAGKWRRLGLIRKPVPAERARLALARVAPTQPLIMTVPGMPPVLDQGDLGSCADNMGDELMEFCGLKNEGQLADYSRLALYYWVRQQAGLPLDQDTGSSIWDVISTLESLGVCYESTWPYNPAQFAVKPSDAAVAEAAKHKAILAFHLPDVMTIDAALEQLFPVGFGVTLNESFESIGSDGIYLPSGEIIGGHAMVIYGCDDTKQAGGYTGFYLVRNSWSASWGANGDCWIPKMLFDDNTAGEAATIRRAMPCTDSSP
ncbi:MAG TPA: C1 family peptidase [Vicinamibacterales bacterium]|nr:C1 family peptidase [Vicinamibacterales bacterium]